MENQTRRPATVRRDGRISTVGDALRATWQPPTDTMITDDIPLLLTRLSKVPPVGRG